MMTLVPLSLLLVLTSPSATTAETAVSPREAGSLVHARQSPCDEYPPEELASSYQIFRVFPLEEGSRGYKLGNPGALTPAHEAALDEIVERVRCSLSYQGLDVLHAQLSVVGGKDERHARDVWRDRLEAEGLPPEDASRLADALVSMAAIHERSEIITMALRSRIRELVIAEPAFSIASGQGPSTDDADSIAIAVVPQRMFYEPDLPLPTVNLSGQQKPHPRDIVVIFRTWPKSSTAWEPPVPKQVEAASVEGEPGPNDEAPGKPVSGPSTIVLETSEEPRRYGIDLRGYLGYLRVLETDHLSAGIGLLWKTDGFSIRSAKRRSRAGLSFGLSTEASFGSRRYALSDNLVVPTLATVFATVGGWGAIRRFRFEAQLAGGLLLPAAGVVASIRPGIALELSPKVDLVLGGGVGVLITSRAAPLGAASIGLARNF